MEQLTLFQKEGLLELDGLLLHTGDRIELQLPGSWIPGTIFHDGRGWYLAAGEERRIGLQAGLHARLLSLLLETFPQPCTIGEVQ